MTYEKTDKENSRLFPRVCGLADVVGQILVILAANTANPIDAVMYEMVQYAHKVDKRSL